MRQIKDSKTKTKNFEQGFKILENILRNCMKYNGVVIGRGNSLKKLRRDTINKILSCTRTISTSIKSLSCWLFRRYLFKVIYPFSYPFTIYFKLHRGWVDWIFLSEFRDCLFKRHCIGFYLWSFMWGSVIPSLVHGPT